MSVIKTMQRCERTAWGYLKKCAPAVNATAGGRTIEIDVNALDQTCVGALSIIAIGRAKAVKHGELRAGADFEDCTKITGAARVSCPVEVPVGALGHPNIGTGAISAFRLRTKTVEHGERAGRRDLKDRALREVTT